ncbi:hypothetical protein SAY87_007135 [Trapa incisa]|uniref:Uncharacterized protein n=1 Tax=Trapa incisa TaxID=236973 RepID=A0AAN7Q0C6_9MYRT|nr:hypothetical protein SAY87_007135 [Trapa incisa]
MWVSSIEIRHLQDSRRPVVASARMLPRARANLNPTAQALIISSVAGVAYFIVADKTVLATARKNSFNQS